jgi:hypothetical protein
MLVHTHKGSFYVEFLHYRSPNSKETQRSIERFHLEIPSSSRKPIVGTTECFIGTVPGMNPLFHPRKSLPAHGITGRSKGDKFSAFIGCRNSLIRALNAARKINPSVFQDKSVRKQIWQAILRKSGKKTEF